MTSGEFETSVSRCGAFSVGFGGAGLTAKVCSLHPRRSAVVVCVGDLGLDDCRGCEEDDEEEKDCRYWWKEYQYVFPFVVFVADVFRHRRLIISMYCEIFSISIG